jgi:hypothetical protein
MRITRLIATIIIGSLPVLAYAQFEEPVRTQEHRQTGSTDFQITTVSARNDMVSGGDVLLRVEVSPRIQIDRVAVTLNGQDVRTAFKRLSGTRSLMGLVTGLRPGQNTVMVRDQSEGTSSSLAVTNWPIVGPIFSGPHEKPYICMTQLFELPVTGGTLGPALDEHCSIATRVDYVYGATDNKFKPLPNPAVRPADLAFVTNNEGRRVAFVVRVETGTINRAIYHTAMLHDPATDRPLDPWTRSAGWNGRLIYTFGGGCPGGWYIQGKNTEGVLDRYMLSQGFAVATSSKNVFGNNCDDVLSAETMMMVKERFTEQYGAPAHTIGWGSSGGAHQVHLIGDNYPGMLDGIIPGASFPDMAMGAVTMQGFGSRLLHHYFTELAAEQWTKEQQTAVAGVRLHETLVAQAVRGDRINPRGVCDETIPPELLYDAVTNPRGARCTVYDHAISSWGKDPKTGFARRPVDNVGVQYGLKTLNDGTITKAQFLDLNEKIGGVDVDTKFTKERTTGDRVAVRRGYEYGRIMSAGAGLASIPIIDYRAYADTRPGDVHMRFHSFSTRERLIQKNGHADNHVMLHEDYSYGGFNTESPLHQEAIRQMDRWLLNIAKDTSSIPRSEKVVKAKPADLQDGCVAPGGKRINEKQRYQAGECNTHFPSYSSPYLVAGMPVANNVAVCQLKAIDPSDYKVQFTPAEMDRLRRIFPNGVCDYTRPGVEQRPLIGTWLSYGPAGK